MNQLTLKALTLSDRQYPMLRELIQRGRHVMPIEEAKAFDQRPFRSMLIRGYVIYRPAWKDAVGNHRGGFVVTQKGRDAFHQFHEVDRIVRRDASLPLTAYFDPSIYGLEMPARGKRKSAAA